ncbi:AAA family ATPase [Candidatus Marithrix sp. Canyon 246]|uniref:AAA family ATPase n=1 Tax=Candidatus Marithrix sp. Canyon 246 TaxID=1827136 RepID=UPI00084A111E|nr:AAA family ATPase [Candidatus Marithrix sp. Canyon 246]
MLKFPYGISNFHRIVTNNYFYVDRSNHIRLIEDAGDQILFLRPRRFGKSLLLSMLENYYDVAKADEFDKLFGNLAIGKNPTPLHNKYLVMKWDFSNINPKGEAQDIEMRLYHYINRCIKNFAYKYQALLPINIQIDPEDAIDSFLSMLNAVLQTPYRLYLLIDEYDNFANEVMMGKGQINPERYKALTSADSSLKAIFKTVKSASGGLGLERVFLTGASPILMSDMTTAYNVAKNIYLEPEFNELCGFQEHEIKAVLTQIVKECGFENDKINEALTLIRSFYDGYCFNESCKADIYNPTLALYFFDSFQKNCKFPQQMLDDNLSMDLNKLTYLSRLPNGRAILWQALNGTPPLILSLLANRFGIDQMLKTSQSNQFIISILYYLGVLTLDGETELRQLRFKIPNLVVRKLYVEHLFEMLLPQDVEREEVRLLAEEFYQTVDLQPICDFMTQRYFKVFDNRDYKTANELTIKTAFLTVLFNDVWYMMDSEMPVERRYSDLSMIVRPDFRQTPLKNFLFEFKYLKLSEVKLTGNELKLLSIEEIETLELVQEKLAEAEQQLLDYQSSLEDLQLISVVAVGFDRLVWKIVKPVKF